MATSSQSPEELTTHQSTTDVQQDDLTKNTPQPRAAHRHHRRRMSMLGGHRPELQRTETPDNESPISDSEDHHPKKPDLMLRCRTGYRAEDFKHEYYQTCLKLSGKVTDCYTFSSAGPSRARTPEPAAKMEDKNATAQG